MNEIKKYTRKDFKTVTDYDFITLDGFIGNINGYVGVSKSHPYFGKDYFDLPDIDVHGGVTYSGNDINGLDENYWYFGFDTAHTMDFVNGKPIRDEEYVINEVGKLYHQLKALE